MNKEQNETANTNIKTKNYVKIINRFLVVSVLLSCAYYLVGTNDLSIKYFVVQENKREMKELRMANAELEAKIMSLSSYGNIAKRVDGLKMVKVDKISYVNANTAVAKR